MLYFPVDLRSKNLSHAFSVAPHELCHNRLQSSGCVAFHPDTGSTVRHPGPPTAWPGHGCQRLSRHKAAVFAVETVFDELGVERVDLIALAKGKRKATERADSKQKLDERIFICDNADPIVLDQDSPELRLLVNIRDEAHRFALAYHKKLRKEQYYKSPLDKIAGIGQIKKKNLLKHFVDMQKIRNASLDELGKVNSITTKDAKYIYNYFH